MSSDVIPVLDFDLRAYLITPTIAVGVISRAETPEIAASALSRAAAPTSVKCALLVMNEDFRLRQKVVSALNKAGYIHIETIDMTSIILSESILNLPLNTAGQVVFVVLGLETRLPLASCTVAVIKKVEAGWQVVQTNQDPSTVLAQHPFVGDVVIHSETPDSVKAEVMKLFPFRKLHLSIMSQPDFVETFIRNRVNKGNLNGYEVLPFCHFNLLIKYGQKVEKVAMQGREIPFVVTKENHIGVADSIDVCIDNVSQSLLKSYSLPTTAPRIVSITISVDKTLIPNVIIQSVQRSAPTSHRGPMFQNRRMASPPKPAAVSTAPQWTPTSKSWEFVFGTSPKKVQSCPSGPHLCPSCVASGAKLPMVPASSTVAAAVSTASAVAKVAPTPITVAPPLRPLTPALDGSGSVAQKVVPATSSKPAVRPLTPIPISFYRKLPKSDPSTVSPPAKRASGVTQVATNDGTVLPKVPPNPAASAIPAINAPSHVPAFDHSRVQPPPQSTIIPTPATQIPPMSTILPKVVPEPTASQASAVALATSTMNALQKAPVFSFGGTLQQDPMFDFEGDPPALRLIAKPTVSTQKPVGTISTTAAASNMSFLQPAPVKNPFLLPEVALLLRTAPTLVTSPPVPLTDQLALPKVAPKTTLIVEPPPATFTAKAVTQATGLGTSSAVSNVLPEAIATKLPATKMPATQNTPATSVIKVPLQVPVKDQALLPKVAPKTNTVVQSPPVASTAKAGSSTVKTISANSTILPQVNVPKLLPSLAPTTPATTTILATSGINVPPQVTVKGQPVLPKVAPKTAVVIQPLPVTSSTKAAPQTTGLNTVKKAHESTVLPQMTAPKLLPSLATETPPTQTTVTSSVDVPLQVAMKHQSVLPTVAPKTDVVIQPSPATSTAKAVPQTTQSITVTKAPASRTVPSQVMALKLLPSLVTKTLATQAAPATSSINVPSQEAVKDQPSPATSLTKAVPQASGLCAVKSTCAFVKDTVLPEVNAKTPLPQVAPKPTTNAAPVDQPSVAASSITAAVPSPAPVKKQPVVPKVAQPSVANSSSVASIAKAIPQTAAKPVSLATKAPTIQATPATSKTNVSPLESAKIQPVLPEIAPKANVAHPPIANPSPVASTAKTVAQVNGTNPLPLATKTPMIQTAPAASGLPVSPPAAVKNQPVLSKVVPKTMTDQTPVTNPTSTVNSIPQMAEKPLATKTSAVQTTSTAPRISVSTQASVKSEPVSLTVVPKTNAASVADQTPAISSTRVVAQAVLNAMKTKPTGPTILLPVKTTDTVIQATPTSIDTQTSTVAPTDTASPQAPKATLAATTTTAIETQTTQKPAVAPVKRPVESVPNEALQVTTPAFPAVHTLEPKSVVCAVNDAPNGFAFNAYLKDESRYTTKFATIADVIAHMKNTVPTRVVAAVFFIYDKAALATLGEFRDACHDAKYCKVRFIPYKSIAISIMLKLAGFCIRQGKVGVAVSSDTFFMFERVGRQLQIFSEGSIDKVQPYTVDFVVVQNTGNNLTKECLNRIRDIFQSQKFYVIYEPEKWEACRAKYYRSFVDTTLNFGNYLCNDFCDFDFTIQDKGFAHEYHTYNKSMPFTVKFNFPVTDTTLPVYAKRNNGTNNDLLKTFTVSSDAKAVELVICVTSPCDIDLKMNFLDKAKQKNVAAIEAIREYVKANPEPNAESQIATKAVTSATPSPESKDESCSEVSSPTKAVASVNAKPEFKDEAASKPSLPTKTAVSTKTRPTTTVQKSGGCPSCKRCCYGQPSSACIPRMVDPPASTKPTTAAAATTSPTVPKKGSPAKVESTVSSKPPIETTTVSLPTSNDAVKNKKSRSQRRKLAQLHAVKNATADEPSKPADLPPLPEEEVQKVGSFSTLPVEQFQLEFDSSPTAILTFTSDNRVLIEAGETYTGVKELLAYVRLRSGKVPQVGRQAFDALKKHPGSVFYDITRLLATDFDPSHADPTWRFKTTRDADGKLLVHGGDNIVTFPIVLFGLVVRSTLLYIQGHLNAVVAAAGIRLPWDSAISDEDLEGVSMQIGTKLLYCCANQMSLEPYALLDRETNVYLSHPVTVVVRDAPTLEAAVEALFKAAPPNTVKGVFILKDPGFEGCRRAVEAVQKAGYTYIEVIETHLLLYSSMIYDVPLNQTVGAVIFIFGGWKARIFENESEPHVVTVLRKCEKGWIVVKENQDYVDAFAEFPSVSDVVLHQGTTPDKTALQQVFGGRQIHVKEVPQPGFILCFLQTLLDNGSVTDYDVLPHCFYDLVVSFGENSEKVLLTDVPPFTITKEVVVGDVSKVEIRACEETNDEKPLVKTFKFKSAAFRTVVITVTVDKSLLPQVTLKTIATRESVATTVSPPITEMVVSPSPKPHDHGPSIIFFVSYSSLNSFIVTKFVHQKVVGKTTFPTFDDAVAFMQNQAPNASTAAVVLQYPESATIVQLQVFREKLQTAGFVGAKLVPTDSVTVALFLGKLESPIADGQFIALLNASIFYIVTRYKGNPKIQEAGPLDQFDDKSKRCKVSKVVVDVASGKFDYAMFDALLLKFRSNVHVMTEMDKSKDVLHQFLWSCVDKTAPNNYAVNDFCDFDIDIPGQEPNSTRFMEFPVIVYAAVDVSNVKTLEVSLVKSKTAVELLKKFKLKHGTRFVQVIVRADTTCDVTAAMNVIGQLTWPRTIILSKCGFDDPFAAIAAAKKKPVEKITLEAPPLSTRYDVVAMKSRHQRRNQAQMDAGKNGTSAESSKPADLSTTPDVDVEKAGSTATLPNELSQLKLNPLPTTSSMHVEKTVPTNDDAKDKKSRSQRKKMARRNAVSNGTAAEASKPTDLSTPRHDKIDNIESVPTSSDRLQLRFDPPPTTILKFTSDNRVLIEANETYTGDKQLLAYVRLQSGKAPIVGKDAFDALQTHPDSVFYDITRLLAADFDPDYPHPLWSFKTTRDADGKLLVHGGGNVVTFPIVLFGLVVNSTLLYVKEHLTTDIPFVGIRLPCGSSISDEDLNGVSEKIGTNLIIVPPTC
uniref:Protein kinase domain-containing protein n=1 Tax=Panagrellus redivivus TaxID=6233 RepID=A0A7E4V7U0_PANRE